MIHRPNLYISPGFAARLMALAITLACAAGCAPATSPKDGTTYTAARHRQLGSNIPQPDSIDTANSTMSNEQLNSEGNNQIQNSMRSGGGH